MRIIVDLSNIAYICFYAMQFKTGPDNYDKRLYLALCRNKIESIRRKTKASDVIFAKDNITKRKLLDKQYKANRKQLAFPFKADLLHELIRRYHAKVYESKDMEADDVMYTMLKTGKVDCIVSTDQDMLQAITRAEQLFNPVKMQFWTKEQFVKKYKLKRFKDILWYKTFFGDSSDNIPRVADRLPRKDVAFIINNDKWKNWQNIVASVRKYKWHNKIKLSKLKRNYALVKLQLCKVTRV